MAKPASRNHRAKAVERAVQQYLWPGSRFNNGAHRPAHEQQDLRGEDRDGLPLWGEVKNYTLPSVNQRGGAWAILQDAYQQCMAAIEANPHSWPEEPEAVVGNVTIRGRVLKPRPFAVLWTVGARREDQKLVMYDYPVVGLCVVTLAQFRRQVIGEPQSLEDDECGLLGGEKLGDGLQLLGADAQGGE